MNFKKIKSEMQAIFSEMLESAHVGETPKLETAKSFARLARQFFSLADEAYLDECEDFAYMADQLHQAIHKNESHEAIQIIESLNDAMQYCHRSNKS